MSTTVNAPAAQTTAATKKKVFIVDDHPIVRQGLMQLINAEQDLTICGQGEDAYQALKQIRALKPDVTLLDISLKDTGGIELLKEMRAQDPTLRVLILSMHDESLYAERALRAGARGYVMKQEAPQVLLQAIRKVLKGEVYVSEKMSAVLLQRMVGNRKPDGALPMDRLTDREMEIFRMIGAGMTVKEIAEKLFLSAKTIEAHREHIKEKLSLKTSAELLRFAIRNAPDEQ
jgi:DNA-binding NarL/FixJ family response regulator